MRKEKKEISVYFANWNLDAVFGKGVKKLTACCAGSTTTILPLQDWVEAAPYMDRINIMSYDMSGVWDGVTGHQTSFSDTKKVVDYFAGLGIDAGKLCIGTPFYALAFKMKEMNPMQIVGVPCETYRASSGIVTERDLKEFEMQARSGYRLEKDGARWQKKLDYIHDAGVGGIIIWEVDQDTQDYAFMNQIADNLIR